jgi:hypothetical protein
LKPPIESGRLNGLDYGGKIHAPDGFTQVGFTRKDAKQRPAAEPRMGSGQGTFTHGLSNFTSLDGWAVDHWQECTHA